MKNRCGLTEIDIEHINKTIEEIGKNSMTTEEAIKNIEAFSKAIKEGLCHVY